MRFRLVEAPTRQWPPTIATIDAYNKLETSDARRKFLETNILPHKVFRHIFGIRPIVIDCILKYGLDPKRNKFLEFVSYCGLWYNKSTDYVYVEPVCTIPQYRKKGIAKCILTETLKRAYDLGAKKAYVISDMEFYKRLGFK